LAAKPARQPIGDQPRYHVDCSAGGKAGNDLDWPGRIVGRESVAGNGGERGSTGCQLHELATRKCHGVTPKFSSAELEDDSRISSFFYFDLPALR